MENVVVVGNQGPIPSSDMNGKHPKNSRHFLEGGLKEAKRLKADRTQNGEKTTMLVYKGNYKEKQIARYQKLAEKAGINFRVVDKTYDMMEYINSTGGFSNGVTSGRFLDKITDFSFVGHGMDNALLPGYSAVDPHMDFDALKSVRFKASAFSPDCNVTLNACATGFDIFNDFKNRIVGSEGTITGYRVTCEYGYGGLGEFRPSAKKYYRPDDPMRATTSEICPESDRQRVENGAARRGFWSRLTNIVNGRPL